MDEDTLAGVVVEGVDDNAVNRRIVRDAEAAVVVDIPVVEEQTPAGASMAAAWVLELPH